MHNSKIELFLSWYVVEKQLIEFSRQYKRFNHQDANKEAPTSPKTESSQVICRSNVFLSFKLIWIKMHVCIEVVKIQTEICVLFK